MSTTKIFITLNIYHKICIYLCKYCIHSNTYNVTMQRNDLKCKDYFFFFFFFLIDLYIFFYNIYILHSIKNKIIIIIQ